MHKWSKGNNTQLSKSFSKKEMECKCSNKSCEEQLVSEDLISTLQAIRDDFEAPIKITSGYRCPAHNKAVGGVSNSAHCRGIACDIKPASGHLSNNPQMDLDRLLKSVHNVMGDTGGIGHYPRRNGGWIHIDVRAKKARWKG